MEREQRYVVLKVKDIKQYLTEEEKITLGAICRNIEIMRAQDRKPALECVCIENDWPEYEAVWSMIAARVDSTS